MEFNDLLELISKLSPLIMAVITVIVNSKLISYKIEQLEKKVEKHNNLVEKVAVLENKMETNRSDIDKLEGRMNEM